MADVRIGVSVQCATCGDMKKPVGRFGPLGVTYCEPPWDGHGCEGYWQEPRPGSLWPGERSDDFGYPVGTDGTAEAPNE
jgi:hypothetical protein